MLCAFVLLLLIPSLHLSRVGLSDELKNKIDSFMQQMVKCRRIPGLMLAVVNNDATYAAGYGVADVDSGRKVDEKTLFNIGSVTKMFTSAILVDIMEKSEGGNS